MAKAGVCYAPTWPVSSRQLVSKLLTRVPLICATVDLLRPLRTLSARPEIEDTTTTLVALPVEKDLPTTSWQAARLASRFIKKIVRHSPALAKSDEMLGQEEVADAKPQEPSRKTRQNSILAPELVGVTNYCRMRIIVAPELDVPSEQPSHNGGSGSLLALGSREPSLSRQHQQQHRRVPVDNRACQLASNSASSSSNATSFVSIKHNDSGELPVFASLI